MNQIWLYSYMSPFLPKPRFYSRSSFNPGAIKDQKGSSSSGNTKIYHEIFIDRWDQCERFSLIQPRKSKSLRNGRGIEKEKNIESSFETLGSGMILLKNYISLSDQVEIVNICEKLSCWTANYMRVIPNGEKLGLRMMLLGPKWNKLHVTLSLPKDEVMVPDKLISMVNSSIQDSKLHLNSKDEISSICSNHCAVKFYKNNGQLRLHEDFDDDSWYPDSTKGWPVVSMFVGDSAELFCRDSSDVNKVTKVIIESGDVLVFGSNSRNIFHGLHKIIPNSAPLPFLEKSMLKPGVLHLSFREL